MAIYRINPGDLATGSGVPAGFTSRWDTGFTVSVEADAESPSGKSIRLVSPGSTVRTLIGYDAINSDADRGVIDAICIIRSNAAAGSGASVGGLAARGSIGGAGTELGRAVLLANNTANNCLRINSYNGSSTGSISNSSDSGFWSADNLYYLRLQIDNTDTVTSTLYAINDLFGTAFGSNSESANASNSENWFGLFSFDDIADVSFLYVGAGTGADSAPLPLPVFNGPVPDDSLTEGESGFTLDLSAYFDIYDGPATYAIQSGSLPAEMSLDTSTGIISVGSTPVTTGTYTLIVRATDDAGETADTNEFDIVVSAATAVAKGASVTLYNGATLQASVSGITAMWWDASPPTGNPVFTTATESTDGSGVLQVDLDSSTALNVGDNGHLMLYKLDGTNEKDSLAWQGRLAIEDIS